MCRLMAYVSETPGAVDELLGASEFASFRELSRLHRDGWGMAWLADPVLPEVSSRAVHEGPLRATRSVLPAHEDPAFDMAAGQRLGAAGFVHLRWATSGLAVAESNTHPFLAEGWAFAHQGSIPSPDRLDAFLDPEWLGRRRGTTDSERYFLYLLQCVEREGDLVAGVRHAVTDILSRCGPASLNAVLLSSSSLVVVHGRAGLAPPRDDLLAAVARPEELPPDHLEGYFRLRYRQGDSDVVITSSGVAGQGWEEVPDDSILHIDLGTRAISLHGFDGSPMPTGASAHLSSQHV
ncbi:MAG: class II glutamine amidotransferase [Acidimicrobiales bacterium]|jgi:predicted glutamine amidotransferase